MATIRYFVPEDGDTEEHPNVFLAPRPRQTGQPPLLRDVRSSFPLPGRYHFRFKTSPVPSGEHYGRGNDAAVWMDCVDDDRPVPVWRNTVLAKIARVGPEDDDDDRAATTNGHRVVAPEPRAPSPPAPAPAPATESLLNVFDEAPSTRATPSSSTGSLLDMGAPPSAPAAAASSYDVFGAPNDELLSMGMSPRQAPPHRSTSVPAASPPTPRAPAHRYTSAPAPRPSPAPPTTFDSFSEKNGPFGGLNWS